jgi:molybdate-binding protein
MQVHYFVCRKDKLETPAVAAFRRWLTERVAEYLGEDAFDLTRAELPGVHGLY